MSALLPSLLILAGGKSTRFKNSALDNPKVLSPIGGKPILWHIIKHYQYYGVRHVILALGQEHALIANTIKELFRNDNILIDYVYTGDDTPTGGRIFEAKAYLNSDTFFVTYGDGLASVAIDELLAFHNRHQKEASVMIVKRHSPFGHILTNDEGMITGFEEKPMLPFWINAGFFVFNKSILNHLNPAMVLETELLKILIEKNSLMSYRHAGFWKCMDTFKENLEFEEIWQSGNAEWKIK